MSVLILAQFHLLTVNSQTDCFHRGVSLLLIVHHYAFRQRALLWSFHTDSFSNLYSIASMEFSASYFIAVYTKSEDTQEEHCDLLSSFETLLQTCYPFSLRTGFCLLLGLWGIFPGHSDLKKPSGNKRSIQYYSIIK